MKNSHNIAWQCRRGMLELDVLFQCILQQHYDSFSDSEKQLFLQLLKQDDPTLYAWLIADVSCTDASLQPIVQLLKQLLFLK